MSPEPVEQTMEPTVQRSEAAACWLKAARPLIVTGAPYCGSSVIAEALQRAGWFPGDRLAPIRGTDSAGRWQDEDIAALQGQSLAAAAVRPSDVRSFAQARSIDLDPPATRQLLHRKFHGQPAWGWKDSRSALLLEAWDQMLPSAHWLFAVRPPCLFTWSLLCRELLASASAYPLVRARAALALWTAYHSRILQFVRKRPDRCALVVVPDTITRQPDALDQLVRDRWHYDLETVDLAAAYVPNHLKKETPGWVSALTRSYLPAQRIFRQLQRLELRSTAARRLPPAPARPKVCIVTTHPFRISETFIYAHATRLPAEVKLLTTAAPGPTTEDGLLLETRAKRIANKLLDEFRVVNEADRTRGCVARYLRREKFAAVLAEFGPNGCRVMEACRRAKVPLVVHFHGYDVYDQSFNTRRFINTYPKLFDAAAALVGVSYDMIERLAALGAPREKLFYNPCGVDPQVFQGADPANAPPTFLLVGRFVSKKAPHLSVLAFKQLLERVPDARLVMIGGGELHTEMFEVIQHLVRVLGLRDAVEMVNARSHYEVALAMRKARAFIQHSVQTSDGNSEGTPVSVLEAGASGLPVVATRHAGIPDVVKHGETGFLVDEYDVGAMAEAMQTLAENPTLAGTLGRQAREHVSANYSMEKSIGRLWNAIEFALRNS